MAIRMRRGLSDELVTSKLLPGEFAICSDGTIVICYAAGKTAELTSVDDLEALKLELTDYRKTIDAILNELKKEINQTINSTLTEIKGEIEELKNGAGRFPIASEKQARMGIEDNVLMTPLKTAQAIEEMASGGGGGGGSTIPMMSSSFTGGSFASETEIEIRYRWSSPNEGYGVLHVLLNNVEIQTEEVQQGLNRLIIPGQPKGNYTLLMYVTDRGGLTTDKLNFVLKIGGLDITSTFDDSQDFNIKSVIRIPVTIDTISLDPIYILQNIDGTVTRLAGQNGYNMVQLPALTPGAHKVSISAESGVYQSNVLTYNVVVEDADTLTIICDYNTDQVQFRDLVEIPYRVSLKGVSRFDAQYLVDGTVVKNLVIASGSNVWSTRDLAVGDHTLRINVATQDGAKSAFVEKRLTVIASSYTPLQPVQDASLLAWFDASGRSNQDVNRTEWTDKSGNGTVATLVDFNYGAANGWIDGALKCNGISYVMIDLQALKDNAPYGVTVDVKFQTRDSGEELACVLDMRGSDVNTKGFAVDTKNMYMNSGSTKIKSAVLENEVSRATFVIDRESKLGKIYNNGVLTEAFIMTDSEDFTNLSKIYLNTTLAMIDGVLSPSLFGDCEIYSIRVYERALSSDEIVQNHIADIQDLEVQEEKYRLNYSNLMPTMYFYGDTSAMTKDTKVPLRIKYLSTDTNKYGESFDLRDCPVGWQGTSSLQYAVKNYKIKLLNQDGSKFKYSPFPGGLQENVFTLKADYMESSHANNTGMCKFINDRLYADKTPPQQADPKKRTAINGFPIQLYIARDDQSTPQYMGVFNFNLDKSCFNNLGLDNTVPGWENCMRFEVSSNSDTSAGAFKNDSDASMKEDFELNYPDPDDLTQEQIDSKYANLKRLVTWVKNSTEATFAAEVEQYFNKDFLLKYYLQVHLCGMVDNLGKNMMMATWDGNVWYPMFYDADSQLALDNTGYLKFYSDIDIVAGTYNTSGSKLWTMVKTVFADELSEMYKSMRASIYTVSSIMAYWYDEQVAKIGEKQYNADMEAKYIQFKSDYLFMLHGRRYEHMKRWITERLLYLDTIYGYEADTRDSITIRANKSGSVYLDILTYSPQYLKVKWRNGVEQVLKVGRDANGNMTPKRFNGTLATSTDQEVIIYNAKQIKRIDNLAGLSPSVLNFVEAEKLVELECKNVHQLTDVRLSSKNKFLRRLDLYNCSKLGTATGSGNTFDLSGVNSMRELDLRSTSLENIVFPTTGSSYTKILFPSSMKVIDLENMPLLTEIPSLASSQRFLSMVKIINCPKIQLSYVYRITADTVHIERSLTDDNTLSGLSFEIGSKNYQPKSITIRDVDCLKSRTLRIIGAYLEVNPAIQHFEISGTTPKELILTKFGFVEETDMDLSHLENLNLCFQVYANIRSLKLPTALKGLAFYDYIPSENVQNYTRFDESLTKCEYYIKGNKKPDIVDLSSVLITSYLRVSADKPIKINVDLSQKDGTSRAGGAGVSIAAPTISGKIKYGEKFYNPYADHSVTLEAYKNLEMDTSLVSDFANAFNSYNQIAGVPELQTSNGTNFSYMFFKCEKLTQIPPLVTDKGTNFSNMFGGCGLIESVPQINTSNGSNFYAMFADCEKLQTIPPLDLSNGENLAMMFTSCSELESIPLLDFSKASLIWGLFDKCSKLREIEQFIATNCSNLDYVFRDCTHLETIRQINISDGTVFNYTFEACSRLSTLIFTGIIQRRFTDSRIYACPLNAASVDSLIAALVDYSGDTAASLRLNSTTFAALTDEQKAVAAAKNWTLTS